MSADTTKNPSRRARQPFVATNREKRPFGKAARTVLGQVGSGRPKVVQRPASGGARARHVVAAMIDSDQLFVALGTPHGRGRISARLLSTTLPEGAVDDLGRPVDEGAIAAGLESLLAGSKTRRSRTIGLIGNPGLNIRRFRLDGALTIGDLEATVLGQMRAGGTSRQSQHVDMMISNVEPGGGRAVLAVAAPPESAIALSDAAQRAGLSPRDVEPAFCGAVRAIPHGTAEATGHPHLIVEVGSMHTSVINTQAGVPHGVASTNIGVVDMSDVTENMIAARAATAAYADGARSQGSYGGFQQMSDLADWMAEMVSDRGLGPKPNRITLCGPGAWQAGLPDEIRDATGLPVGWPTPPTRLRVDPGEFAWCPAVFGALIAARFGANIKPQEEQA